MPLKLAGESEAGGSERVLELAEPEQTFIFDEVPAEPVPRCCAPSRRRSNWRAATAMKSSPS